MSPVYRVQVTCRLPFGPAIGNVTVAWLIITLSVFHPKFVKFVVDRDCGSYPLVQGFGVVLVEGDFFLNVYLESLLEHSAKGRVVPASLRSVFLKDSGVV